MSALITITDENFSSEVTESSVPVLLDFWAEWCGPCRMLAPVLEEVAKEFEGRIKVGKVNVDEAPETASRFGVRGIPTLTILQSGNVEATKVGAMSKSQLISFIEENLG